MAEFEELNVQVLGISIDHVPCLQAWAKSLDGINFPMLSDFWPHGEVSKRYGVLREDGMSERAVFIVDQNGIIQFIDIRDKDEEPTSNEVLFEEIRKIALGKIVNKDPKNGSEKPVLPEGGVVMYCNSWCPDCKWARQWLDAHDIPYSEVDIPSTPGAADQVRAWADGNLVTPTFNIDGTIILDFDEEKLTEILDVK